MSDEAIYEVFKNDKKRFLQSTEQELKAKTKIIDDEEEIKSYGTLVFPEAYAYLLMFTQRDSIPRGMSLIVDLGGSTTDISFFNISATGLDGQTPVIYNFKSLNIGTNQLYIPKKISDNSKEIEIEQSWIVRKLSKLGSVKSFTKQKALSYKTVQSNEINESALENYKNKFDQTCETLILALINRFQKQKQGNVARLYDALINRPIIFAGGGSMNPRFRLKYEFKGSKQQCFSEPKLISSKDWEEKDFDKDLLKELVEQDLIALLSTAYGLAHAPDNASDEIDVREINEMFETSVMPVHTETKAGYDHNLDYDAFK